MTSNARVEISVASPWFTDKTDRVFVRASETVRRLAAKSPERGGLSRLAVVASGYVVSLVEAASASGATAIDYRVIKVDTSTKSFDGPADSILGAKTELAMIAAYVGQPDWSILMAVCVEGLTVEEAARGWHTAKVLNGKADAKTREAVGRRLRDALEAIGDRFIPKALRPKTGSS
ncbi:hypothetical protein [Pleomorphomonas sp. JP5]|uniref:hypothetical protein n=1 Tax=Pleomorphomonas sp. JP5 TaxID=2942998 RepID=UPI0020440D2B|nr:hypothetical protein [Pleomorphomonas sp. JP5]MCM5556295.1 hypothetical protein [Pleomorphomonas sp. JP5]